MFEIFENLWHALFDFEEDEASDAKEVWSNVVIEDGRTMLVGFGETEEESKASMLGDRRERDTLVDSTGLLKIVMPAGVHDSKRIPDAMIKNMSEHFGIENIFNSSKEEPDPV